MDYGIVDWINGVLLSGKPRSRAQYPVFIRVSGSVNNGIRDQLRIGQAHHVHYQNVYFILPINQRTFKDTEYSEQEKMKSNASIGLEGK